MEENRHERLRDTIRLYIRAVHLLDTVRLQVWERMAITFPQLRILFRVRAQPGIDLRTLARDLGITASGTSQQVDKLVARGFLLRQEDLADRRRIRLELTGLGQQAMGEISRASQSYLEAVFGVLSDAQLGRLARLLDRLLAAGAEVNPEVAPEEDSESE
jgi:DNA-binding MarR family transcriptional regulator